jgi:E-phenylitaconyl-CoA hydratase
VATVVLEPARAPHAIDTWMRRLLRETLLALDSDPDLRVLVLTGAGSAFCAGVDLAEPASPAGGDAERDPAAGRRPVAEPLWSFRKPAIAAINGPAVGGGLELALACDIRIASASARFGLPEVRIGSLPGSGGTQRLPRIVGPGQAARMIFTGELIDSADALRIGLVSDVVADDGLAAEAADLARRIAASAPLSLVAAKEALRGAEELGFSAGQALERRLWGRLAATDDRAVGRAAFLERREPTFSGR